jgi:hypothetical protein
VVPDSTMDRIARLVLLLACVGVVVAAVGGIWR